MEYTVDKNISSHLLKKKVIYDHILDSQEEFLDFFGEAFPPFKVSKGPYYTNNEFKVFIVYCSKTEKRTTISKTKLQE